MRPPARDVTPATETVPPNTLQVRLMTHFARHILEGEPLRCDAASGRQSLELANAITLSSHQGAPVELPVSRAAYDTLLERLRNDSRPRKRVQAVIRETDPRLV